VGLIYVLDAVQLDAETSIALEYPSGLRAQTTCNFNRLARDDFKSDRHDASNWHCISTPERFDML
jgi:hypothetical protein